MKCRFEAVNQLLSLSDQKAEDYPGLFKLSEDKARIVDGTPIMTCINCQAIRNVMIFSALKARLEAYA